LTQVARVVGLVRAFDALLPFDDRFNAAVMLWREVASIREARAAASAARAARA
jgi:hypothetical protein